MRVCTGRESAPLDHICAVRAREAKMSRLAETPKVLSSSIDAEDHAREAIVRPTLAPQIDMPGLGTTVVMTAALRGALAVRCLAFESGLA